jgi:hypothetical protein
MTPVEKKVPTRLFQKKCGAGALDFVPAGVEERRKTLQTQPAQEAELAHQGLKTDKATSGSSAEMPGVQNGHRWANLGKSWRLDKGRVLR